MIIIYSTFPSRKEAKKIGEILIKEKLAVCLNIFPIESMYFWKGRIVNDREFAAIIKTKKDNFKKVERVILENHSYDTPCVLEIPVGRVAKKYPRWLNASLQELN